MKPARGGGPGGDLVHLIEVDGTASFAALPEPAGHAGRNGQDHDDSPVRGLQRCAVQRWALQQWALQRWSRWSAAATAPTPKSTRGVAALALGGVIAAFGTTLAAGAASHPVRRVVRTVPAPTHFAGTDALGCPVGLVCVVRASAAIAAVRQHSFANAAGFDVLDVAHPRRPFARYLTASRGASRLRVVSTCDSHRRRAAVDEPPQIGSTVTYRPGISAVSAGGGGPVVTAYYARHDTFGCTVEVLCSYPVPMWSARLDTTVEQCAVAVDSLGMDSRVYL